MSHDSSTPGERDARLQTETLGSEVVVLDEHTGEAHLLRADAAAAWQEADTDLDRRRLLQRAGTLVAASSVISVVLPMASAAASPLPGPLATPVVNLSPPDEPTPNGANTLSVSVVGANGIPTGTVSLFTRAGGVDTPVASQQNKTLDGLGQQTFTVTGGAPGSAAVTYVAKYSGDVNYSPASGTATLAIPKATPTITVTDEDNHTTRGYNYITATVTGGYGEATGIVDFQMTGTHPYSWTGSRLSDGKYRIGVSNDGPAGVATVRVHYYGDATYAAGDSEVFEYLVTP